MFTQVSVKGDSGGGSDGGIYRHNIRFLLIKQSALRNYYEILSNLLKIYFSAMGLGCGLGVL